MAGHSRLLATGLPVRPADSLPTDARRRLGAEYLTIEFAPPEIPGSRRSKDRCAPQQTWQEDGKARAHAASRQSLGRRSTVFHSLSTPLSDARSCSGIDVLPMENAAATILRNGRLRGLELTIGARPPNSCVPQCSSTQSARRSGVKWRPLQDDATAHNFCAVRCALVRCARNNPAAPACPRFP